MERIIQLLISSFWPLMKAGLKMTVPLTLVSFALGMILAFVTAMCRISKNKLLSKTAQFYVWVIRGTPMIVQLFVIFYGLPKVGIMFSPIVSAIIGLTISEGAYDSEIIRAALTSIPKGQWEACHALGMSKLQTLLNVIIPQAALIAVPSLGNMFISLVKDTSLTAILTVREVFQIGQQIVAVTFEPLWIYLEVGVIYLIYSTVLSQLQGGLERKLGKHMLVKDEK
ncbi:amino acid ABC transporter permease [Hungatella hathewayi]|uniref:amino acid ABC transporter permease n=1 Tax=Hungatella hathewayi TaxID=154046 RepID=UPI003566E7B8